MSYCLSSLAFFVLFIQLICVIDAKADGKAVTWAVPSHLSAEKASDEAWIRAGLENKEILSSLAKEWKDGDSKDSSIPLIHLIGRGIYLLLLFWPVAWSSGLAYCSTWFRNNVWYKILCWALENGGAAFIKWGQWSSTRPDMFPVELCTTLSKLQANAPVHNYAHTANSIEAELGSPISDIFSEFEQKPIASGSIAQIYRARLNGEVVAVKVRHPNVEEQIKKDFIIMKWLAGLMESLPGLGWLNLSESMAQFSGTIASQTRLDIEGWHLYLFNKNFKQWKNVSFPQPLVLTRSVLVESFEEGDSVAKWVSASSSSSSEILNGVNGGGSTFTLSCGKGRSSHEVAAATLRLAHFIVSMGEDIYLKMLIQDNLMHADLHPGNILIHTVEHSHDPTLQTNTEKEDGGDEESNKIVLVDAGMTAKLQYEERINFIGFLATIGEGNGTEAADFVLNFSPSSHYPDSLRTSFREDMKRFFNQSCRGYHTGVDLGDVLRGILSLCRTHKVSVNSNYATLIMNAMCLDGLAVSLLPSYNILDGAKMFLRFHRMCAKRGCLYLAKYFMPLARRIKGNTDRRFLKKELQLLEENVSMNKN